MSSNTISVVGTVASDPRLVRLASGVTICSFRLASGERRYDRAQQKWVDGETNWFGVNAFRTLADHAKASFRKGERIIVQGRLRVRRWENGDRSGTSVEIDAEALGHDLRWGVSRFDKHVGSGDDAGASEVGASDGAGESEPAERPESGTNEPEPRGADGFLPAAA